MGSRTRLLLLMIVLLFVALLVAFRAWRPLPGNGSALQDSANAQIPTPAESQASVAPPVRPSAPLPPSDTPIFQTAAALTERADAGDSRAACRLGLELLRCQQVPDDPGHMLQEYDRLEMEHRKNNDPEAADRIVSIRVRAMRIHAACQGVPEPLRARAHHYVRQAALAGEPEAMLRYASGESLSLLGRFERLRSPEFEAWRREAPAVLQRALAAGVPEAVHLYAEAHRPSDEATTSAITWLIADDPVRALAFTLLQRQLSGGMSTPAQRMPEALDDAGRSEAQALADQWQQQYFAGADVDPERLVLGLAPMFESAHFPADPRVAGNFCPPTDTQVLR